MCAHELSAHAAAVSAVRDVKADAHTQPERQHIASLFLYLTLLQHSVVALSAAVAHFVACVVVGVSHLRQKAVCAHVLCCVPCCASYCWGALV